MTVRTDGHFLVKYLVQLGLKGGHELKLEQVHLMLAVDESLLVGAQCLQLLHQQTAQVLLLLGAGYTLGILVRPCIKADVF